MGLEELLHQNGNVASIMVDDTSKKVPKMANFRIQNFPKILNFSNLITYLRRSGLEQLQCKNNLAEEKC